MEDAPQENLSSKNDKLHWLINNYICLMACMLLVCTNCKSQNLVPNSAFENFSLCPISLSGFGNILNWYNPTAFPASPDYFHHCSNNVPLSAAGYQQDHSNGGAYVGITGYGAGPSQNNQREYVQVELKDSMKSGHIYCIEFYVCLHQFSGVAITSLGAWFSDTAHILNTSSPILIQPSIENSDTTLLTDSLSWMKVSGEYLANGGEKFMTIGNFRDSANSNVSIINPSTWQFAYYIIDDVSVVLCDNISDLNEEISIQNEIIIAPNPANDQITIFGIADSLSVIKLFNTTGILIKQGPFISKLFIDGLEVGVYYLRVESKQKSITKKFMKL